MYLIDTCTLSELLRAKPAPIVMAWFAMQSPKTLFTSRVCMAEAERGVAKLSFDPKQSIRHAAMQAKVSALLESFDGRILAADNLVWSRWSVLMSEGDAIGKKRPELDTLIAASAAIRGFSVVTRNVHDFEGMCEIINPWEMPPP